MSALVVQSLCKSFGGLRVTGNVSLTVEPGERRLIIGPNGAGKTTLFNLITGELTPDSGSIKLFGRNITGVASRRRAHLGMARTYQIIAVSPRHHPAQRSWRCSAYRPCAERSATSTAPASRQAHPQIVGPCRLALSPIVRSRRRLW